MNVQISQSAITRKARPERYSVVAIALHWTIAASIALQILIGWRLEEIEGVTRSVFLNVHRSVGVTILLLTVFRLVWRLVNKPPAPPAELTSLERIASHWVHMGFYALLLALPLSGWAMTSLERTGGMAVFGKLSWPAFPLLSALPDGIQDGLAAFLTDAHGALAWVMIALLVLHVAGALKHHFISKDPTVGRMAPGVKPGAILEPRLLAIPAVAAAVAALAYLPTLPEPPARPAPKDLASADIYLDIVDPALTRRCGMCHSDDESRGGLSLTSYDSVMRGGRHGAVIKVKDVKNSELFRRVHLEPTDKRYMPQGEKPPLSADQIAALEVWVNAGAPRGGPVGKLGFTDAQKAVLQKALPVAEGADDNGLPMSGTLEPLPTVAAADEQAVRLLEENGFIVRKIDKASNLLTVNFNSPRLMTPETFAALVKIGPQIYDLNLRKSGVTDAQLKEIAKFKVLRTLQLQDTPVTDAGVSELADLSSLRSLTLVSTKVTNASLSTLGKMKLKSLYVWNTAITPDAAKGLGGDVKVVAGVSAADVPKDTTIMKPAN